MVHASLHFTDFCFVGRALLRKNAYLSNLRRYYYGVRVSKQLWFCLFYCSRRVHYVSKGNFCSLAVRLALLSLLLCPQKSLKKFSAGDIIWFKSAEMTRKLCGKCCHRVLLQGKTQLLVFQHKYLAGDISLVNLNSVFFHWIMNSPMSALKDVAVSHY